MKGWFVARSKSLHFGLLSLWFILAFGIVFFANDLRFEVFGWPVGFWFAAQGSMLMFVLIVGFFAWRTNQGESTPRGIDPEDYRRYTRRIHRRFGTYVVGLLFFMALLAFAEQWGLSKAWVAGLFLLTTLVLYAGVGVYGRTSDASEYFVAGRRIPAFYNGMATAADWMSAASFISLAGGLYLQGFSGNADHAGGLAYILGWTGGFCLVALLVAPYLRRLGIYTVPDFFAMRFGGRWPRLLAALAAVLCSFTYVVAQLYGVGLITSRLTGVHFEIGILLGLGGVLVCSFLGGMRAVTWTQVTQYVLIILAFLIPVSWLAYKQVGSPLAPWAIAQQLQQITQIEKRLLDDPAELQVIDEYRRRAAAYALKLKDPEAALRNDREELRNQLRALGTTKSDDEMSVKLRRELAALPKDVQAARERWAQLMSENLARARPLGGMPRHTQPYAGDPDGSDVERETFSRSRLNFVALIFCLMVGTAGLPHLLTRYYTTPSVAETRTSVAWSLLFISALYLSAPALAVLVKYEIMSNLVGQPFDSLPHWVSQWARDPTLLTVTDINGDRLLQFAELNVGADLVMFATPEIGGLPYVFSVLVAAGALAAALSTADGLLLTIGNALAHDVYFKGDTDKAEAMRRVMWSKFALLIVALVAAYVAAQRPAGILYLVSASFSLAGAAFVPAMVLGIFWRDTTRIAAVGGMLVGLGVTVYYMVINQPGVRSYLGLAMDGLWWGIQPVSAGVFGVAAGIATTVVLTVITRPHANAAMHLEAEDTAP